MKNIGIALGLSLALGLGAAVAHADEPVVGPVAPAAEEKPLVLRESKAEAPAQSSPSTTTTLLKGLGVAGVAIAAFALFKRKKIQGTKSSGVEVKIVGRTALGMRTEVCVVDVGGERLVLGVTPTTVTTLSILQDAPVELGELADLSEPREATTVRTRARSLAEEPESALLRLLDNARKQTANVPVPARQTGDAPISSRRGDDVPTTRHDLSSPTTRHDLDADATLAIPPKAPAPPRQRQPRRIEEQVRGLNVAKSRRAS